MNSMNGENTNSGNTKPMENHFSTGLTMSLLLVHSMAKKIGLNFKGLIFSLKLKRMSEIRSKPMIFSRNLKMISIGVFYESATATKEKITSGFMNCLQ